MAQTTRTELFQLGKKSKRFTIELNTHDGSFAIVKRHPTTNKIVEGFRCFVSGHCLDLSDGPASPCTPHEAAVNLKLI
jgi:hypothetical protein